MLVFTRTYKCYRTMNSESNHGNTHPRRRVNKNVLEHSASAETCTCVLPVGSEDDVRLICTWAKPRRDKERDHLCSSKNGWKCWVFQLSQPIQIKAAISSNHWSRLQHTSSVPQWQWISRELACQRAVSAKLNLFMLWFTLSHYLTMIVSSL